MMEPRSRNRVEISVDDVCMQIRRWRGDEERYRGLIAERDEIISELRSQVKSLRIERDTARRDLCAQVPDWQAAAKEFGWDYLVPNKVGDA